MPDFDSPVVPDASRADIIAAKKRLRAQGRAIRAALNETERAAESAMIYARLMYSPLSSPLRTLFESKADITVAAYLATPYEANIDRFIAQLLERAILVSAPRGNYFAPLESLDAVTIGRFGVREPSTETREIAPSVIFVPGLFFDRNGGRLGFGGGWYDRALARFPQAVKIGIAFVEQIIPAVPREPHDIAMDFVVTPGGVVCAR